MEITMALSNYKAENEFFSERDTVFAAICKAVSTADGMKIRSRDKLTSIMVKRTEEIYIEFQLPLII
jgi:hypothetical protein